jgi:ribose transport system ATP-binding protein
MEDIYPRIPHELGGTVLELRGLAGQRKPRSVSFALRAGEILGVAGLIGAGRTETLRACFGLDRVQGGSVFVHGKDETRKSPSHRLSRGIGLLSENRKEEGLLLDRSLADNLTLTRFGPLLRFGFINARLQWDATAAWIQRLGVRAQDPSQKIGSLSGGNQQKLAIGRLLHHQAEVLLLDEPTRGIDVGSKAQIYRLIGQLAAEGKAIIFVSSYLPELLGICDTIGVMCRGVLTDVRPRERWTEHSIIAAAISGTDQERSALQR